MKQENLLPSESIRSPQALSTHWSLNCTQALSKAEYTSVCVTTERAVASITHTSNRRTIRFFHSSSSFVASLFLLGRFPWWCQTEEVRNWRVWEKTDTITGEEKERYYIKFLLFNGLSIKSCILFMSRCKKSNLALAWKKKVQLLLLWTF